MTQTNFKAGSANDKLHPETWITSAALLPGQLSLLREAADWGLKQSHSVLAIHFYTAAKVLCEQRIWKRSCGTRL